MFQLNKDAFLSNERRHIEKKNKDVFLSNEVNQSFNITPELCFYKRYQKL